MLAMFLNHNNARLVENVLWILRNLSDAATKQVRTMFVNTMVRSMMWEEIINFPLISCKLLSCVIKYILLGRVTCLCMIWLV